MNAGFLGDTVGTFQYESKYKFLYIVFLYRQSQKYIEDIPNFMLVDEIIEECLTLAVKWLLKIKSEIKYNLNVIKKSQESHRTYHRNFFINETIES